MQTIQNIRSSASSAIMSIPTLPGLAKNKVQDLWVKAQETNFWKNNLEPLHKSDYIIMGTAISLATIITAVALHAIGMEILPLAAGLAGAVCFGCYKFASNKANKAFDIKMWDHVNDIRTNLINMNLQSPDFTGIRTILGDLEKPEFSYREKEITDLKSKLNSLQTAFFQDPQKANLNAEKEAALVDLQKLQERLVPGKAID
jgi:hypothetical protein